MTELPEYVDVMPEFKVDSEQVTEVATLEGVPYHMAYSAEQARLTDAMVEAIRVEAPHRLAEVRRRLNRLRGSQSSVAYDDVRWCLWSIRKGPRHEPDHFSRQHFYRRFPEDEPGVNRRELFAKRMDAFCEQAGIPDEFWRMEFRDVVFRDDVEGFRDAYSAVKGYGRQGILDGLGFLFRQSPGTGKTLLASMAAKAGIRHGFDVVFATATQIIDAFKPNGSKRLQRRVYEADLLIIDDWGQERPTEFTLVEWDRLMSERYDRRKAIVITSNFSSPELEATYSPRLIDRIRDRCRVFDFDGTSFRGRDDERQPTLFER